MRHAEIPILTSHRWLRICALILAGLAVASLLRAWPRAAAATWLAACAQLAVATSYFLASPRPRRIAVRWSASDLAFAKPGAAKVWIDVDEIVEDGVSFQLIGNGHRHHVFLAKGGIPPDLLDTIARRQRPAPISETATSPSA